MRVSVYLPCISAVSRLYLGSVESALSIYLENFATTIGSREQLAIAECATPNSATPNSATPNSVTPNSATPNSVTPNSRHRRVRATPCTPSHHHTPNPEPSTHPEP